FKIDSEIKDLARNIKMMKDVIATQQEYAKPDFLSENITLTDIVEDTLSVKISFLKKSGIKLNKIYGEQSRLVKVQKIKLINVLINLIKNSKEAMIANPDENHLLTIETGMLDPRNAFIRIKDNGVGIAPEIQDKIFKHGFTTKKDGHGFGL